MRPSVGETAVTQPGGRFPHELALDTSEGGGGGAPCGGGVSTVTPGTSVRWPCTMNGACDMIRRLMTTVGVRSSLQKVETDGDGAEGTR
jgi:hypothetical protein